MTIDEDRIERLISASEAQTNALTRLVQALEERRSGKVARSSRVSRTLDRPVVVDDVAAAAARQAIARHRARS